MISTILSHPRIFSSSHSLPTITVTNWAQKNLEPTNSTQFLEVLAFLCPPLHSFLTSVLRFPRKTQLQCGKKEREHRRGLLVLCKSPSYYKLMIFLFIPSYWGRCLKWRTKLVAKLCKFPLQDYSCLFLYNLTTAFVLLPALLLEVLPTQFLCLWSLPL